MRIQVVAMMLVAGLFARAAATTASQEPTSNAAPSTAHGSPTRKAGASSHTVTYSDNNREITVARGTLLVVRLAANPSTGYSWQVGGDAAPLALQSSEFEATKQDQRLPGSPEVQVLRFKTTAAGTAMLFLEYRRPWEKNAAPAKTFRVTVTVQ